MLPLPTSSMASHSQWRLVAVSIVSPLPMAGGVSTNLGFVNRELDDEVGLYQLGARWYDPELGQFAAPDPIPSS